MFGKKKPKKKPTTTWGKIWFFLWEDNSVWSWIVNIILAYVLIKFIVYPGLGLLLGTTHPIVAVVSGSMTHDGSFSDWWASPAYCSLGQCNQSDWYAEQGISEQAFKEFSLHNGFRKGDIIILVGSPPERINPGDIIVFTSAQPDPIIHRVVRKASLNGDYFFQTKGDHNPDSIRSPNLNEAAIHQSRVIGKAVVRIPFLGWIKIGFVDLLNEVK